MQNVKNTMIDKMLSVVAPHLCSRCGKVGSLLCDSCKYDIMKSSFVGCIVCGAPTAVGICQRHHISYQRAWVVGERKAVLQRLIGNYKFQNMKAAAETLADLLDERLPDLPIDTVIVPIPTASSHIRERGYDHLLLIAKYLALKRGVSIERLLGRANTATQHHANREKRIEQAQSAFRITGEVKPDQTYLLVDDVVTTGSTIDQASRLLAEAGARTIWVAAVARQPLD